MVLFPTSLALQGLRSKAPPPLALLSSRVLLQMGTQVLCHTMIASSCELTSNPLCGLGPVT